MCVIVQPPKPTFLLDEIWDGLTNRRFGVVAAVHFRCGCVDCLSMAIRNKIAKPFPMGSRRSIVIAQFC